MRVLTKQSVLGSFALAALGVAACQTHAAGPPPAEPPTLTDEAPRAEPAPAPAATEIVAEVELANPSEFAREKTPVYLSYYELGLAADDARATSLAVKAGETALASQANDSDGDGRKDGVLSLLDFAQGETKKITVVSGAAMLPDETKLTQAEISHKVGGQWRPRKDKPELKEYVGGTFQNVKELTAPPEHTDHSNFIRYEGPGIESDKVGYRIYLDWRNGFDIFGKKTSLPVLQRVGQDGFESYHHMADWGMDILKVGESLGAGGFGFWDGKKVVLVSKVDGWTASIIENGNLYSSFRIAYKGWQVNEKKVDLTADFSMVGGSRAVHVTLRQSEELPNLAIGLVKHPGTELLQGPSELTGTAFTYVGSFGKQSLNDDLLGMAVLFPSGSRTPSLPARRSTTATTAGTRTASESPSSNTTSSACNPLLTTSSTRSLRIPGTPRCWRR